VRAEWGRFTSVVVGGEGTSNRALRVVDKQPDEKSVRKMVGKFQREYQRRYSLARRGGSGWPCAKCGERFTPEKGHAFRVNVLLAAHFCTQPSCRRVVRARISELPANQQQRELLRIIAELRESQEDMMKGMLVIKKTEFDALRDAAFYLWRALEDGEDAKDQRVKLKEALRPFTAPVSLK
jgi:hypothetical protein